MKLAITRFVIVAAIAVLMVAVGSTAAWAQTPPCPGSPNYSPDFTGATFTVVGGGPGCLTANNNGDAGYPGLYPVVNPPAPPPVVATVLRLTPNSVYTAGSVW